MFVGEEDSPFGSLPAEVIVKIFKASPNPGGKWTARKVCRRWRSIVDETWWGLASFKAKIDGNESSAVDLMKSRLQFESLFITGIRKSDWPQMSLLESSPKIQRLTFGTGLSQETLLTFLSCGGKTLEYLSFLRLSLTSVASNTLDLFISREKWSKLVELQIFAQVPCVRMVNEEGTLLTIHNAVHVKFLEKMEAHSHAITGFLRSATLPKLKIFNFNLGSSIGLEVSSWMTTVISEFTGFLDRHGVTLKDLSLSIFLGLRAQPTFCLIGPIFSAERQESIGKKLKLECLSIRISHSACLVNLVPQCLWKSSNLTKFAWTVNPWKSFENGRNSTPLLMNPVQSLISRNQGTLESVNIMYGYENPKICNLKWLETCSALRNLTLTYIRDMPLIAVKLPQVTTLKVCLKRWGHRSDWITKFFENLKYICITGLSDEDNNGCEWLEYLLPLIKLKLKRINFFPDNSCSRPSWFFDDVKIYCRKNAQLDYVSDGLINVLSPMEEVEI